MNPYETAILFDPELPEERRKEFVAKLGGVIAAFGGTVSRQDDWGGRKLAYPIRKRASAFYTFLHYTGNRGVVEEVERNIKISDGILRYLTCRVEAKRGAAAPAPAAPAEGAPTAAPEGTSPAAPPAGDAPPA